MSLGSCWAHGGVAVAGRRALPAVLCLCCLLMPITSHALTAEPDDAHVADGRTAQAVDAVATTGPSPRLTLALVGGARRPGGESGRGRGLTITLYSAGTRAAATPRSPGGVESLAPGAEQAGSAMALLAGGKRSPGDRQATLYRLDYAGGPLELTGHVVDVGARFSFSPGGEDAAGRDGELIKQALGGRGLNLGATWKLASGLSLTSSHDSLRRDNVLSEQNGLTASDSSHALTLNLGQSTAVKASLTQHREEWDRWLGRAGAERQEQKVELTSTFGAGGASGLRMAMTTARSTEGESKNQQGTKEVHLNLAPGSRLKLNADYLAKGSGDGAAQTTKTIGAAVKLAPEAELKATTSALDSSAGEWKQETALALTAKVLGGQLLAEHKLANAATGLVTTRKYACTGAIGGGAARTNVKLDFQESRGGQPDSPVARNAFLHLDRQLLPWLNLAAERRERITGTLGAPIVSSEMKYFAVARLGGRTELQAGFVTGAQGGLGRGERRLALSREWKRLRLRAESGSWDDETGRRSVLRYSLEVPTGELPDWAKAVSAAHQFEDAGQYYLGRKPEWLGGEMQFAGYRLQVMRRAGGPDGVNTLAFTHRRIVARRYHLQLNLEERPEGTDEDDEMKGRPLPLRREAVEIGGPVFAGLNLRCGLGTQRGAASSENKLGRVKLGLWGKLHQGQQVEAEVWRERGEWDDAAVERASVALLYSHRVSDENRVELKLGYTWCDEVGGDRSRDCRFALAYERPV